MSVVGNNCAENDPKAMAKKQKSGAMALVGVTNSAQRKLVKMEEKHAERYELLEKERQADDAIRDELEVRKRSFATSIRTKNDQSSAEVY